MNYFKGKAICQFYSVTAMFHKRAPYGGLEIRFLNRYSKNDDLLIIPFFLILWIMSLKPQIRWDL